MARSDSAGARALRPYRAARGVLRRLGLSAPTTLAAFAGGAILAAGVATAPPSAEPLRLPPADLAVVASPCDADGFTVGWQTAYETARGGYVISGVSLGGVLGSCTIEPVTLSLLDATSAVLASVTLPPAPAAPPGDVSLTFDLSADPVLAEAIHGLAAEIPDPIGTPIALPAGTDVTVAVTDPANGATIAIALPAVPPGVTLTAASLTAFSAGYVPPAGFVLTDPAVYFSIEAPGLPTPFTPPVEICVYVDPGVVPAGADPRIWHYDTLLAPPAWTDATTAWSPADGRLCGAVTHFSPFALGFADGSGGGGGGGGGGVDGGGAPVAASSIATIRRSAATTVWGSSATLVGRLTGPDGTSPVAGATLVFERSADGTTWTAIATGTTGADGTAGVTLRPATTNSYRVRFGGSPVLTPSVSGATQIAVRYRVVLRPASGTRPIVVGVGTATTFTATVRPESVSTPTAARPVVTFIVSRQVAGRWSVVSRTSVTVGATGTATFRFRPTRSGTWGVRAAVAASATNAASSTTTYTVLSVR